MCMTAVVSDNIRNIEVEWCGIGEEPGWYHFKERDGICVGDIQTIWQQTARGVSSQGGDLSPSRDLETDNKSAIQNINRRRGNVHSNTHQVSLPPETITVYELVSFIQLPHLLPPSVSSHACSSTVNRPCPPTWNSFVVSRVIAIGHTLHNYVQRYRYQVRYR